MQVLTQKAVVEDQQQEIDALHKENKALGSSLTSVRHTLKKTRDELEERVRKALETQDGDIEQELTRTRERLKDSENRRSVLALQLLNLQKEVEEIGRKGPATKTSATKASKALEDENSKLREELRRLNERNTNLVQELSETKLKLEENESETQHAILRKQVEGILKDKQTVQHPHSEAHEGARFEDSVGSRGISESRSNNRKANPSDYKSEQVHSTTYQKELSKPNPKLVESAIINGNDEDRELQTKVYEYFERKYPGVLVEQTGKSRFCLNQTLLRSMVQIWSSGSVQAP